MANLSIFAQQLINMETISIQQAQKMVDDWIHQYGVRYFSELTNMKNLLMFFGCFFALPTKPMSI